MDYRQLEKTFAYYLLSPQPTLKPEFSGSEKVGVFELLMQFFSSLYLAYLRGEGSKQAWLDK